MSIVKKIINYSFWLLIGNSFGRLTIFVTNILAARMLSQEVFGQFLMMRNTISMVEGVVSGTLGNSAIKHIAEESHENKDQLIVVVTTLFIINLFIDFIITIILIISTPYIIKIYFFGLDNLAKVFYVCCFLFMATSLASLMQSILIGFEQYKKIAASGIVSSLISFPFVLMVMNTFGLIGLIGGIAFYFTVDFTVKYYFFRKIYKHKIFSFKWNNVLNEGKKILTFSAPIFFSVVINSIAFWYARVLTVRVSQGFASIAIFDSSFQWLTIIMIITGATTSVALPMLSGNRGKKDLYKNIFYTNVIINLFVSSTIAGVLIFFSKEIMSIYGNSYVKGSDVLVILAIVSILFTLSSIFNKFMISKRRTWIVLFSSIMGVVGLFLTLNYFLYSPDIVSNDAGRALAFGFMAFYLVSSMVYLSFYLFMQLE